jgi:hypothetical protein
MNKKRIQATEYLEDVQVTTTEAENQWRIAHAEQMEAEMTLTKARRTLIGLAEAQSAYDTLRTKAEAFRALKWRYEERLKMHKIRAKELRPQAEEAFGQEAKELALAKTVAVIKRKTQRLAADKAAQAMRSSRIKK